MTSQSLKATTSTYADSTCAGKLGCSTTPARAFPAIWVEMEVSVGDEQRSDIDCVMMPRILIDQRRDTDCMTVRNSPAHPPTCIWQCQCEAA